MSPSLQLLFHLPVPTAFGMAGLCFRRAEKPLTRVLLPGAAAPSGAVDAAAGGVPPSIASSACALAAYFEGAAPHIPPDLMDLSGLTACQKRVLAACAAIPWGETLSYADLAAAAGLSPRAARFVGNTMAKNPFPVFIPCHRVVRADGSLGGFGGGTDLKARMLAMERACGRSF
ncbi:MAG: MGMT family protein [Deltaproteobacteria bacterium]|nr:MGMT family protein [Deltaproteobacteria bacterium]